MNQLNSLLHNGVVLAVILEPLALILIDLITAIVKNLRDGTFRSAQVADVLQSNLAGYLVALGAVAAAIVAGTPLVAAITAHAALFAAVNVAQLGSIAQHVAEMTGLPDDTILGVLGGLIQKVVPQNAKPIVVAPAAPIAEPVVVADPTPAAPASTEPTPPANAA